MPLHEEELSVRVGIVAKSDYEWQVMCQPIRSAGWSVVGLKPDDLAMGVYEDLDVVVIPCTRITPQLLELVQQASLNPRLFILVVCEEREPQSMAEVLRAGASDYLPSPFAEEEFIARIRALAMRSSFVAERRCDEPMVFNFPDRMIVAGPLQVTLSQREWDALLALLDAESTLVTIEELSERLTSMPGNETIVTSAVSRLRRKLRASQFHAISIETVHGHGYMARFRRSSDTFSQVEKIF